MRKTFLLFVYLLVVSVALFAQIPAGYYDAAAGKSGAQLKTALFQITGSGFSGISYSALYGAYITTDAKPGNVVWDMYTDIPNGTPVYIFHYGSGTCGNYSKEGDCYNREHSMPQSWFNSASPMVSDLFHVYPTDGKVNGMRSNYPHGKVLNATYTSSNGGKLGSSDPATGYSGIVFEPIDEYKGDFARTYLYMATRYEDKIGGWAGTGTAGEVLAGNSFPVYKTWFINLLVQWHQQDPVSTKETSRNDAVYAIQHNRNPFIDHPEYVNVIWGSGNILVSSITVTGAGGATTISTPNGTLQMSAAVLPDNTANKSVTWSVSNGTGSATIDATSGLLTALTNGNVTVKATAKDGSNISGSLTITLSNQPAPVLITSITVSGAGNAIAISTPSGTLQMSAAVLPANATNKAITWSVTNGTGSALISASGLLTAVANGVVTVKAASNDGSTVFGSLDVTLSNQPVLVTSITVSGAGGATTISTPNGTLQMSAAILPSDATNKTVTWSVIKSSGDATIDANTGLLTALSNGLVTVQADAADASGVYGALDIMISNQPLSNNITEIRTDYPGFPDWTDVDVAGSGYLQLLKATSSAMSPAMNFSNYTNRVLNFKARTYGGAGNAVENTVTISISIDNGTNWTLLGTVLPANSTMTAMTQFDLNAYTGTQVRIKFTVGGTISTIGAGIDDIAITGVPATGNLVSAITVTGTGNATTISTSGGTLQMLATVLPADAANKDVTWSVVNGTGSATISATGLLTAVTNGTVTVKATAKDGSNVMGSLVITISNQITNVSSITVTGTGNATTIATAGGSLQMIASILPADATNKNITWSVISGTGSASVNASGLLTAIANGTVTVKATAQDGSGVSGSAVITISNQPTTILVSSITVSGTGNVNTISTAAGTLQMIANISPADATNKEVIWSITNGMGNATISATGLLTAISDGLVTVKATANDGSGVSGILNVTISNQPVNVTSITVSGTGNATTISTYAGTLQMIANVLPANATNKSVTWSVANGTGSATISASGLLTAVTDGTVTVKATAQDGTSIFGTLIVTISNQIAKVSTINVTGNAGATTISTVGGTLQMFAEVLPAYAANKAVTWSVNFGSGSAFISETGLLTANTDGNVTVKATAKDGSGVVGTLVVTISNQTTPVSSITVSGAGNATVINTAGGTLQMNTTILPANASNKGVTWSVANETGSASISASGLLTAISNGTVTVKATAQDGSGVSGSLVVTISNQPILVTSITVSVPLTTGGSTIQAFANLLPANATNKAVTWSIENGTGSATINNTGVITVISTGLITVKATAQDGSGVFDTETVNVSITGFDDLTNENSTLNIFPNPVQSTATIQFSLEKSSLVKLEVYSITGAKVGTLIHKTYSAGEHSYEWNTLKEIEKGIYIIKLKTDTYTVEKLIVKISE